MIARKRLVFAAAGLAGLLVQGDLVLAQSRSALVLEKDGTVTPDVKPFTEIRTGTVVALASGSRLKFLHYQSCRTVLLTKGSVRFDEGQYVVHGATPESETAGQCPRRVTLKEIGEAGATSLRGPAQTQTKTQVLALSSKPAFILLGEHREDFLAVNVSGPGLPLLEVPLDGPWFHWPPDAMPLTPNEVYELILVPKVLGVAKVKKVFRVIPANEGAGSGGELVVLDLD